MRLPASDPPRDTDKRNGVPSLGADSHARRALEVLALLLLGLTFDEEDSNDSTGAVVLRRTSAGLVFAVFADVLFHVSLYGHGGVAFASAFAVDGFRGFLQRTGFVPVGVGEELHGTLEALEGWSWLARGCYVEAQTFDACRVLMVRAERDGTQALESALDLFGAVGSAGRDVLYAAPRGVCDATFRRVDLGAAGETVVCVVKEGA